MSRTKTHTYTKLKVHGDKKSVQAFLEHIKNQDGTVRIVQQVVLNSDGRHTNQEISAHLFGDYDTQILRETENEIVIEFWSYYDPLIHGITALSEMFPDLTFRGAYFTTLKATLGMYTIENGHCNHGNLTPQDSLEMKNFCCEWDEKIETTWFRLADKWVSDMTGEPISA